MFGNLNVAMATVTGIEISRVIVNLTHRKQPKCRAFVVWTIRPQAGTMSLENIVEVGLELDWIVLTSLQVRLVLLIQSFDIVFEIFDLLRLPLFALTDDGTPQT